MCAKEITMNCFTRATRAVTFRRGTVIGLALRTGLLTLALLGTIGATSGGAQSVTPDETVRSVQRTLERLPYYGVFDYIVFRVNGGTVYLAGYSFEGRLKGGCGKGRQARERCRRGQQPDRGAAHLSE
jgi:hypothetical protein